MCNCTDVLKLFDAFDKKTQHYSSSQMAMSTPEARLLMKQGEKAIRCIFSENLLENPHTLILLCNLTGISPSLKKDQLGVIKDILHWWKEWGEKNGYLGHPHQH